MTGAEVFIVTKGGGLHEGGPQELLLGRVLGLHGVLVGFHSGSDGGAVPPARPNPGGVVALEVGSEASLPCLGPHDSHGLEDVVELDLVAGLVERDDVALNALAEFCGASAGHVLRELAPFDVEVHVGPAQDVVGPWPDQQRGVDDGPGAVGADDVRDERVQAEQQDWEILVGREV
jgi:hypothetical protein